MTSLLGGSPSVEPLGPREEPSRMPCLSINLSHDRRTACHELALLGGVRARALSIAITQPCAASSHSRECSCPPRSHEVGTADRMDRELRDSIAAIVRDNWDREWKRSKEKR